MKFLVTGGGGYVGFHIGLKLVECGHQVILLDVKRPSEKWTNPCSQSIALEYMSDKELDERSRFTTKGMIFLTGDVCDSALLLLASKTVDCVIHTASFGMSGREQMTPYWDKVEKVNISGTRNVIEACARNGCRGLVYTSTNNVCFGGQVIVGGDETLEYFPLHRHVDHYSRTKAIAEQLVLTSNGRNGLQTCALRLAGVIGPGEPRHIPRIVKIIRSGLLRFNYFDQHGAIVDFIGIHNVVQGHVKAALKLCEKTGDNQIGGQAYFLADGKPVNNLEYFRPLIEHFGKPFPTLKIPLWLLYVIVWLVGVLYALVYKMFDFTPFLTLAELKKTSVTHYFSIEKARRDFGYEPTKPNDFSEILKQYELNCKSR